MDFDGHEGLGFPLVQLINELEDQLGKKVDFLTSESISRFLRQEIMTTKKLFMKDNIVHIRHIQVAIQKVAKYIAGYSYKKFRQDDKTIDAVVREIEIIGEASTRCPAGFRQKYPNIPWREMISARNKMIHD